MKFVDQKKAWEKIFKRIYEVKPSAKIGAVLCDSGIEFSLALKNWFSTMRIKLNRSQIRAFRLSRGIPGVEAAIRRIRITLQREIVGGPRKQTFSEILRSVEKTCNKQNLSSIGMSANTALLYHDPSYVAMVSESNRIRKRKHLKEAIVNKREIKLFSIVKIKKYQEKLFKSTVKESYEHLSPCFIIFGILRDRQLSSYKLANLFTFVELPGSYSYEELYVMKLSYFEACELEEKNISDVLKVEKNILHYNIMASDRVFLASP